MTLLNLKYTLVRSLQINLINNIFVLVNSFPRGAKNQQTHAMWILAMKIYPSRIQNLTTNKTKKRKLWKRWIPKQKLKLFAVKGRGKSKHQKSWLL